MAKGDIVSVRQRPLTEEEQDIIEIFEKLETESLTNLEAGARQIVTLVTSFYGLLFGLLALGRDSFEASLNLPPVSLLGVAAILLLLAALAFALLVLIPRRYEYGEKRLDQMKSSYYQLLAQKSEWLKWAGLCFGLGLTAFAVIIIILLLTRL